MGPGILLIPGHSEHGTPTFNSGAFLGPTNFEKKAIPDDPAQMPLYFLYAA